ncbi:hypothetical protein KJ611_01810 [Patescibacteria group bacterium]|nr:hypothetical protein [Patescibacteria group bacterium]MBU1705934.1 hypothetical protein [Patescibacteria group bacterium]
MSNEPGIEGEFFGQNIKSGQIESIYHVDESEIQGTFFPVVRFIILALMLFAGSFYGALRLTIYILRAEPGSQIVSLADPIALQALVKSDQAGDGSPAGAYLLHLSLQRKAGGADQPMIIAYHSIVETTLIKDNHGQCYLMFYDLAFKGYTLEEQTDDPGLHSDVYGLVKVPCSGGK